MTNTEVWGLFEITWILGTIGAWLQLQRATTAERSFTQLRFYVCLVLCAFALVAFASDVISRSYGPPSSFLEILALVSLLANLGIAMNELGIAFRARNAADQRAPADNDT